MLGAGVVARLVRMDQPQFGERSLEFGGAHPKVDAVQLLEDGFGTAAIVTVEYERTRVRRFLALPT